jgi:hypothetical protein
LRESPKDHLRTHAACEYSYERTGSPTSHLGTLLEGVTATSRTSRATPTRETAIRLTLGV